MSRENSSTAAADVSVGENGAQHATVQETEEQNLRQDARSMGITGAVLVQRYIDLHRAGGSSHATRVPRKYVLMTRR